MKMSQTRQHDSPNGCSLTDAVKKKKALKKGSIITAADEITRP